jgi:hypothetical protein|tara:strand:+ start:1248 stop:1484 length:237 start_codon:yes stop_codon:yes gene_type:complete
MKTLIHPYIGTASYTTPEMAYLAEGGTIKYNTGNDSILHHLMLNKLGTVLYETHVSKIKPHVEEVIGVPDDNSVIMED